MKDTKDIRIIKFSHSECVFLFMHFMVKNKDDIAELNRCNFHRFSGL